MGLGAIGALVRDVYLHLQCVKDKELAAAAGMMRGQLRMSFVVAGGVLNAANACRMLRR